jgi:lysophospholipase L1-like esterase
VPTGENRQRFDRSTAALLIAAVGMSLGGAEVALRTLRPLAVGRVVQPCIYEPDPELAGFRYRPDSSDWIHRNFESDNQVRINSEGFHDRPLSARAPDELRIAALGDSFTAGIYLPIEAGWPRQLEGLLRARRPATRVINLGLDGTGTSVQLGLLEQRVADVDPDIVLLAFYANDPRDDALGRIERSCHRDFVLFYRDGDEAAALRRRVDAHLDACWAGVRDALYRHSYLWRLGAFGVLGPRNLMRVNVLKPPGRAKVSGDAPNLEASLQRFARMARRHGFAAFIVPVPPQSDARGSLETLERRGGEIPVPVIDVNRALGALADAEQLEHGDLFYRYDNHLNADGQRLFAQAVAEALLRADLPR